MAKVVKTKEMIVQVPHKVGALAVLLEALANSGVNLVAMCGQVKGRQGIIRLVTSDAAKAARAVKKVGFPMEKNDVLLVEADEKPGPGAVLASALAKVGVNIHLAYASSTGRSALLVLHVDKPAVAVRALKKI
jgi:hypothetical protein